MRYAIYMLPLDQSDGSYFLSYMITDVIVFLSSIKTLTRNDVWWCAKRKHMMIHPDKREAHFCSYIIRLFSIREKKRSAREPVYHNLIGLKNHVAQLRISTISNQIARKLAPFSEHCAFWANRKRP